MNDTKATMTPEELKRKLESGERVQLIDVRSPGEFASGHLPCAVNMPLEECEARLEDLRTSEPVVLICQSGRRAGMACEMLLRHRQDLQLLEGGTDAWAAAKLPVVRSGKARWSLDRQVRLGAGAMVLAGVILGFAAHPGWFGVSAFVGAGLTFSGLTNVCGLAAVLGAMPWNKPSNHGTRVAGGEAPGV